MDWVSCDVTIPSDGDRVLLFVSRSDSYSNSCSGVQRGVYVGRYTNHADWFGHWLIDGYSYFETPHVTHWMPLPEEPDGE